MIDSMVCKAYKLNTDYIVVGDDKKSRKIIDKGRIILHSTHYGESKNGLKTHLWILATPTLPAKTTYNSQFDELGRKGYLVEINLEDEHCWINNHLNKQVRFYLRNSKYITSRVLTEKHKIERLNINGYTRLWPPPIAQGAPAIPEVRIYNPIRELLRRIQRF